MFNLSPEQVRDAVVLLVSLILSVAIHEFGHAFVADRLGDRLPRNQGRVTLNPMAHADPIGTLLLPLMAILFQMGMFGWGRPVQVNPVAFSRRFHMRTSMLLVAAAGPAMNILLALSITVVYALLLATDIISPASPVNRGIVLAIHLNWILCLFNLLPVPPLDGGTILAGVLPDRYRHILNFLQQYGFYILIGLLITGLLRFVFAPASWLTYASVRLVHALAFG